MASGAARSVRGSYVATGAQLDVTKIGFRPSRVELLVFSGTKVGVKAVWQDSMPDASMHKSVAAGTNSVVTTNAVTPLAGGFRMGTDADLNNSGDVVHFTAYE